MRMCLIVKKIYVTIMYYTF